MPKLITFAYERPGKGSTVYDEWLLLDRPDVKVLLQESYAGPDVTVRGATILEHGAQIIWFVFADAWHDIGRFYLSDDSFTGWYTNLCKPVRFDRDVWNGSDLFLDLWQPVTGDHVWLDEDELHLAVQSGLLDAATRKRIHNERSLIDLLAERGEWPPPIARDIDLTQARALLNA